MQKKFTELLIEDLFQRIDIYGISSKTLEGGIK